MLTESKLKYAVTWLTELLTGECITQILGIKDSQGNIILERKWN